MNSDMVRAVLEGSKTQTRRVIKVKNDLQACLDCHYFFSASDHGAKCPFCGYILPCPYGEVGDRLWVRESARVINVRGGIREIDIEYQADNLFATVPYPARLKPAPKGKLLANGTYREASRITLEITGVRVERLNDISERDAWAESCEGYDDDVTGGKSGYSEFAELWQSIYGTESWQANPWVWIVEFKRVQP
jgi:ribosomal protein S27E